MSKPLMVRFAPRWRWEQYVRELRGRGIHLLEDTTMYIRRESFMLEFFTYTTPGPAVFGATPALLRVPFA